jgi:carboxyl-terminal processing protease
MNIVVIGVISDSPAAKAGIKVGDIIKKIDDKSLENTNITELTKYVKENKNELYNLIIVRDKNEMNVTIERSKITIKSVLSKTFERNNKKIGYIYMSVFANATVDQFEKALAQLEKENIDGLIIDVRSNTGGHLTTAVSIVSNFLDDTNVIYQIEQNNKKTKHYSIGDKTKEYPIVVLQNNGSASASELLSSSLKEAYGATIIGTTSYGKGTVQEMVKLKNGDSYKFTTKKWLTPKGNSINKKGVKPDVEIELSDEYINNPSDDTDNQLQEAINYLTK